MTSIAPNVVRDLVPTGRLRSTINLGNTVLAQQHLNGELGGASVDLARELARRLGVEAELHPFDTAGKAFAALQSGECDIGFLAIDPKRAEDLDYTAPYVIIEGTYLVPASSPLREVDDVDRDGVRIAAGKNTAYDLHLSRALRHAYRSSTWPGSRSRWARTICTGTARSANGSRQSPFRQERTGGFPWHGGMANSIAAGVGDLAMIDTMKIGGVTGWLNAMGQAEAASLPLSSHTFNEPSAHVLAVSPTAHWLEYLDLAGAVLTERLLAHDGKVAPRGPGLGIVWDEQAVRHHSWE